LENVDGRIDFCERHSLKEGRRRAENLCHELGLTDLERDTSRLTILEVKKMEIARALANEPEVLFLDEVMAGLNSDETKEHIAMVQKIAREKTSRSAW